MGLQYSSFPSSAEVTGHGRSSISVLAELYAYNPVTASDIQRLAHSCYLKVIGVTNQQIEILFHNNKEEIELVLEKIIFAANVEDLIIARSNNLVFEDNFNEEILQMTNNGKFTYERLVSVCSKYEKPAGMEQHIQRSEEKYQYFTKLGFSKTEAKANVLAIAFYTGSKSERINRASSLVARKGNGEALATTAEDDGSDTAVLLYYLVSGLSNIPFYWGNVIRACELTEDELKCYKPGHIVSWLQFSSSKKGNQPPNYFAGRNTFFLIYSLTGRPIREFSNFQDEDEILFLPHSTFVVVDHQVHSDSDKIVHHISMRQIELGFSKWSVLWVDDHIFDEKWENKKHMEKAASRALNRNVHFIPKSNTESALSFLRSPFGQRLKNKANFRIVTDMNRSNEHPSDTAGARLIHRVRAMGFANRCLVFTSSEAKARRELQKILSAQDNVDVFVTVSVSALENFINFGN